MQFDEYLKLLTPGGFLLLGAFLTAVRGKMSSAKQKNTLHVIFYVMSGIVTLAAVIGAIVFWKDMFPAEKNEKPKVVGLIIMIIAFASGILLSWFTYRYKTGTRQYRGKQLDKIVNKFTSDADKKISVYSRAI